MGFNKPGTWSWASISLEMGFHKPGAGLPQAWNLQMGFHKPGAWSWASTSLEPGEGLPQAWIVFSLVKCKFELYVRSKPPNSVLLPPVNLIIH